MRSAGRHLLATSLRCDKIWSSAYPQRGWDSQVSQIQAGRLAGQRPFKVGAQFADTSALELTACAGTLRTLLAEAVVVDRE